MQPIPTPSDDAAIIGRLIKPDHSDLSPDVAREILSFQFGEDDQVRMRELSLIAREGTLTPKEQSQIESYRRVGYMIGVLWSKARLSLKRAGMDVAHGHHA